MLEFKLKLKHLSVISCRCQNLWIKSHKPKKNTNFTWQTKSVKSYHQKNYNDNNNNTDSAMCFLPLTVKLAI